MGEVGSLLRQPIRGKTWGEEREGRDGGIKRANIQCRSEGRRVEGRMVREPPPPTTNVSTSLLENSFGSILLQFHAAGFFH